VTGLRFALRECPLTLKPTIQNIWLITIALGNAIVAVLEYVIIFENPEFYFYFYGVLMLLLAVIFGVVAFLYEPVPLLDEISLTEARK
jgi:hypothetical protein